tara:strand:+ start:567 stop:764 length:198 start_codon:yes stop_codon:yes gene_type:complete
MNADEIRAARHQLGLSQVALADALGLSPLNGRRAISRWEDGTVPVSGPAALAIRYMLKYGPLDSL